LELRLTGEPRPRGSPGGDFDLFGRDRFGADDRALAPKPKTTADERPPQRDQRQKKSDARDREKSTHRAAFSGMLDDRSRPARSSMMQANQKSDAGASSF
jgi:hypothetical protein